MVRQFLASSVALLGLSMGSVVVANDGLPEGPIRERHERMESIGAHARQIGAAMKVGDREAVAQAAAEMARLTADFVELFPPDSQHRRSRALRSIWREWDVFDRYNADFGAAAEALVATVRAEEADLGPDLRRLFGTCKSCHEAFRTPEP